MNILHIDSSIQGKQSVSRKLSAAITHRLLSLSRDANVVYRDLAASPLPQFSADIANAVSAGVGNDATIENGAGALCSALEEVLAADVIIIGAPMYNFSIPTQLKSWLDALAVPGKTFRYGPGGVEGLLGDKRVIVASARGGFYSPGTPGAGSEHHESYLRSFFAFLGIVKFDVVRAEGVRISDEIARQSIETAMEQAALLEAA